MPSWFASAWVLSLALVGGVGCADLVGPSGFQGGTAYLQPYGGVTTAPTYGLDNVSYWDGDGVSGSPRIRISLGDQRAYFFRGDRLVGVSLVSTGREGHRTTTGSFKITQKSPNHRSNLYGNYVGQYGEVLKRDIDVRKEPKPSGARFEGTPMPYFMRVHGAIGLHAGYLPGYPASAGCIRMPEFMAQKFFANAPLGTPVAITN